MPSDIFKDIITLEKEIRDRLAEEQKKADAWLAEQYAAMGEKMQEELQTLENAACREKEAVVRRAEEEASRIVAAATRQAEKLKNLEESRLREVVKKKLPALLPGES